MPSISALLINYNGHPEILEAIESLQEQKHVPDEIIVVDNGSTDGSIHEIERRFPDVRLIRAGKNLGFAAGCNLAADQATGRYLALLNSDASADSGWLENLVIALESEERFAVAVGKIYAGRSRTIEQAGALFNNLGNYWGRGYGELDEGQYDEMTEVAGPTGCAMLVDREALGDEHLFDPDIFMYGEELDLTIRLRRRGSGIVYTPDAIVYHAGMKSVTKAEANPRLFQQFLAQRNRMKIIGRYYPGRILLRSAHLLLLGVAYWLFWFLRTGGAQTSFKAARDMLRSLVTGRRQRSVAPEEEEERWLSWMTWHSLRGVAKQLRRMKKAETVRTS